MWRRVWDTDITAWWTYSIDTQSSGDARSSWCNQFDSIEFWTKKQDWLEVKFLHWLGMNLVSHNSLLQGLRLPNRHMLQTTQLVVKSVRELTLAARMQMSEWIIWLPSHYEQFGPSFQFHRSVNRAGRGKRVTTLAPKNSYVFQTKVPINWLTVRGGASHVNFNLILCYTASKMWWLWCIWIPPESRAGVCLVSPKPLTPCVTTNSPPAPAPPGKCHACLTNLPPPSIYRYAAETKSLFSL